MAALPAELDAVQPQRAPSAPGGIPRSRRHLHVAPRRRRHSGRYLVLMVALTALGVFGAVTFNALAAEQSFAARELQRDVDELRRTSEELIVEVTRLESPVRLQRAAKRRLGMVRAEQPAFVMLRSGGKAVATQPRDGDASADPGVGSRTITASVSGG